MGSERVVGDIELLRGYPDVLRTNGTTTRVEGNNTGIGAGDFYVKWTGRALPDTADDSILFSHGGAGVDGRRLACRVLNSTTLSFQLDDNSTLVIENLPVLSTYQVIRVVVYRKGTSLTLEATAGSVFSRTVVNNTNFSTTQSLNVGAWKNVATSNFFNFSVQEFASLEVGTSSENILLKWDLSNQFNNATVIDSIGGNNGVITDGQWWKFGIDDQYGTATLAEADLVGEGAFTEDVTLLVTDEAQYIPTEDPFWDDVRALQGAFEFKVVDKFSSGVSSVVSAVIRRRRRG